MLCARCKKNQATKTYELLKNGKKSVEYYCLSCYHEAFLSAPETSATITQNTCPYCGTTAENIQKSTLAGCAYCYSTLAHVVAPMIKKMQSDRLHAGKTPYEFASEQTKKRILELTTLAKKCRAEGDYDGVYQYEKQIARLLDGQKEEWIWDNHHLSKQS